MGTTLQTWGAGDPRVKDIVRRYLAPWQLAGLARALGDKDAMKHVRSSMFALGSGACLRDVRWSTTQAGIEVYQFTDREQGLIRWGTLVALVKAAVDAHPAAVARLTDAVRAHGEHSRSFNPCPSGRNAAPGSRDDWWQEYGEAYFARGAELLDAERAAVAELWDGPPEQVEKVGQLDLLDLLERAGA